MRQSNFFRASLVALLLTACGGSGGSGQPTTTPESAPPSGSSSAPAPADSAAATPPAAEKPAASEPEKKDEFRLTRTPKDIVTASETAFVFSFQSSDVGIKAQEECEKSSGGDAKKQAECIAKRRDKLGTEVHRFVEKPDGWWWVNYQRKGSTLVALHRIAFEWGEETKDTVTILLSGKDKGRAPMAKVPSKLVIEVPNEYSIALTDPTLGRMIFEAKIGIVAE